MIKYGIIFEFKKDIFKEFIKYENLKLTKKDDNVSKNKDVLFKEELENILNFAQFVKLKNNFYQSKDDDINSMFDIVELLSTLDYLDEYIEDIHWFEMNGFSNLFKRIKNKRKLK